MAQLVAKEQLVLRERKALLVIKVQLVKLDSKVIKDSKEPLV